MKLALTLGWHLNLRVKDAERFLTGAGIMKCGLDKHHRRPLRLKEYDYRRAGMYFVTICTKDLVCWFGDVVDGKIRPNPSGDIVSACWHDLPNHYPRAQLDAFVIMPNHVHGIIVLVDHAATIGAGFGRGGVW